jgi:hypothetical protein
MKSHDEYQDKRLLGYRAERNLAAANLRFKMDATLVVQTVFQRPDSMDSTVLSHGGSDFIRERVFDEILKAERETHKKEDKQQVDITPRNYDFVFAAKENCDGRDCYRLSITPKRKDKYSIKGDIWVDAEDFAIVRLHGAPAKKPSFWTLKTEVDKRYRKIDGVWLPERLDSSSNIFVAGRSTLSIEYKYDTIQTEDESAVND